jgi:tetratricopeptide (TPR) repeat protein
LASRTHIFPSALVILAVCAVALGSHGQKQPAPPAQKPLPTLSAQQIFKHVAPSVMVVESLDANGKVAAFGSGVVIAPDRVITNRHVIEDGAGFRVEHDGKKWPAKLVRVDPDHDLAELFVAGLGAPVVTVFDSSKLAVGETVYAIGAPEGLELTISEGLISGLRDFDKGLVIQISAAISPGSSGGGLFDSQGRLVGVTTFYLKEGQSLNFALPAEWTLALNRQPANAAPNTNKGSPEFQALVWFEVGCKAFQVGKYEAAVNAYRQALRLKPDDAAVWGMLGTAYYRLKRYEETIAAELRAIQLRPSGETAEVSWDVLAIVYSQTGEFDSAVRASQEALRIAPDDELAWRHLGSAYRELGKYDRSASAYREASRLKPDDELAWIGLALDYGTLNQYENSVSALREVVRLRPDDTKAWYLLGLVYRGLGQQSEVIKVYERLKTLDPKLAEKFFKAAVLP